MLSEKDKLDLLKEALSEFSIFNYSAKSDNLEVLIKNETVLKNVKNSYDLNKIIYRIHSLMLSLLMLNSIRFSYLESRESKYREYETTICTYIDGELSLEPLVTFEGELDRKEIVYLDIVPTNEVGKENINIYRYDITNKSEKDISNYNSFNENSDEFLNKRPVDEEWKTTHYQSKLLVISQNKDKYIFDYDSFITALHKFFPINMIINFGFLFIFQNNYKTAKIKYEIESDKIRRKISPYIDYKDYYKYLYEYLKADVERSSELDLLDNQFSSLYEEASNIEKSCQKLEKLLRK